MTRDDFIRLQNIAYLDQKHKKGSWGLHTNPTISIWSWVLQHLEDVFFFQDGGEINETQVPFTIGIQTPTQCECRNPNLAECGGEAQHLEKLGIWSPPGLPNF